MIYFLLLMLAFVTSALTLAGYWGQNGWLWDLTNHFRPEYFILQCAILGIFIFNALIKRCFSYLNVMIVVILILTIGLNGWQIVPYYQKRTALTSQNNLKKLKILHINVLGTNRNSHLVAKLIRETKPDVLTLAEYNERWQQSLTSSGALNEFRDKFVVPYGNDGIYSSVPFSSVRVEYLISGRDPTTIARFKWEGKPVTLLMVHPRPPVKPIWYQRHKNHFAKWEKDFPQYGQNVLIVGDLNTSPWAHTFRHLIDFTKLKDSQLGFGIQTTWPSFWPRQSFRLPVPLIPIDHVLVSDNFNVISRRTGPYVGSDHLPVIVELALK
jgi:endonuclease/exonuclease/phosphatase (EEP) superfamily protein YafD